MELRLDPAQLNVPTLPEIFYERHNQWQDEAEALLLADDDAPEV